MHVRTERLELVPATAEMVRAEMDDRRRFAALLGAVVPDSWPPPLNDRNSMEWAARFLEADATAGGWGCWYVLLLDGAVGAPLAIGTLGCKGRPTEDGTAEIGYSLVPSYQRRGYATEAVG